MSSVPLNHLLKIGDETLNTTAQTLSGAVNELKESSDSANAGLDVWTAQVTQSNGMVVFDNLNPAYGYKLHFDSDAVGDITIPHPINVNRSAGTNTGTMKLTYTMYNGTDGVSKYRLRIMK